MMNKEEILRKIGNILQELNEQHQYLSDREHVNLLELELFTANADFLLDHIEIFKKLSEREVPAQLPPTTASPINSDDVKEITKMPEEEKVIKQETQEVEPKENIAEPAKFVFDFPEPTEMIFDFERKLGLEEVFDRKLTNEEQQVLDKLKEPEEEQEKTSTHTNNTEQVVEEVGKDQFAEYDEKIERETDILPEMEEPVIKQDIREEPLPNISTEIPKTEIETEPVFVKLVDEVKPVIPAPPVAESPLSKAETDKKMSLNEMLSAQRNQASFSRPVTDLKSAISLNDKMIFIKELFSGYNLAYSEAIEILNRFDSFEAADNFLMKNYAEKNNWAQKQTVVDRLYEILNRKFKN